MTESAGGAVDGTAGRAPRALFVFTILIGSFLLFLVQPMVARMALPRLGGAPAVWNSAMLVYQALLLGGYAYAHALTRLSPRMQALAQFGILVLAAIWLPIGLIDFSVPEHFSPALWVPLWFGASIGPLFLAVAAQAPLVQRWYAAASGGRDPYALYAASNLGSFGGLIAYPLIVEPLLPLTGQSLLWSAGYAVLVALVALVAWRLPTKTVAPAKATARLRPRRIGWWILLAFVPSGLMLATSTFITTDIVAAPLLWVFPLGLYLLSFTLAFSERRWFVTLICQIAPMVLLMLGGVMMAGRDDFPFLSVIMALVLLFVVASALHIRLHALRPRHEALTGYYLAMALGGALGGVFAGLIAPMLFDWTYEYPLLVLAAGMLMVQPYLDRRIRQWWRADRLRARIAGLSLGGVAVAVALVCATDPGGFLGVQARGIAFVALMAIGLLSIGRRWLFVTVLACALFVFGGYRALVLTATPDARERSYFGVYTIRDDDNVRVLTNGTTVHGEELLGSPERERAPTAYYVPQSGIGRAMDAVDALYGQSARIAVVGLGSGTLACYARPGQHWRFFEIDPMVRWIARDSGKFEFLKLCLPQVPITIGDARLSLSDVAPDSFDLLVLDAFSSDSVPVHLMTREAFATYGRALAPDGLMMVHVSNRYLALAPVVAGSARAGGWHAQILHYRPGKGGQGVPSDWIALSRDPAKLAALTARGGKWQPLNPRRGAIEWTDDHAAIVPLLRLP